MNGAKLLQAAGWLGQIHGWRACLIGLRLVLQKSKATTSGLHCTYTAACMVMV